jgi:anti-sigma factor RsiW
MHPTEATLRSYLDHELTDAAHAQTAAHLAACEDCQAHLQALDARAARVGQRLALLAPDAASTPRPAHLVYARWQAERTSPRSAGLENFGFTLQRSLTMLRSLFSGRYRPVGVSLALIVLLAVALSAAPVRTLASQLLGIFRVQQVAVVPVDMSTLEGLSNNAALSQQAEALFAESVKTTREAAQPQEVATVAEASAAAGFPVRVLDAGAGALTLTIERGPAMEMTINRARAQALLEAAGHTDIKLPATLDGAPIAIDIPAAVVSRYGACRTARERQSQMDTCLILTQMPSPTVTTPPDLNMQELAAAGLQMAGLSPLEAQAFSRTVDWTSTLVIPIPVGQADYQQVFVDSVTGYLIASTGNNDLPSQTLIWTRDGMIYDLTTFNPKSDLVAIAGLLH